MAPIIPAIPKNFPPMTPSRGQRVLPNFPNPESGSSSGYMNPSELGSSAPPTGSRHTGRVLPVLPLSVGAISYRDVAMGVSHAPQSDDIVARTPGTPITPPEAKSLSGPAAKISNNHFVASNTQRAQASQVMNVHAPAFSMPIVPPSPPAPLTMPQRSDLATGSQSLSRPCAPVMFVTEKKGFTRDAMSHISDLLQTGERVLAGYAFRKLGEIPHGVEDPILAANGNFKMDLSVAMFKPDRLKTLYMHIILELYGLTNMTGSTTLPTTGSSHHLTKPGVDFGAGPLVPTASSQSSWLEHSDPAPKHAKLESLLFGSGDMSKTQPILSTDENLMSIINARASVLLNPMFHNTKEQLFIVRLADAAICIFRLWHETRDNHRDAHNEEYLLYLHMLPVIREDIHRHLFRVIESLPAAVYDANISQIQILTARTDVWRWIYCERQKAERGLRRMRGGNAERGYWNMMRRLKANIEQYVQSLEYTSLGAPFPAAAATGCVHPRSQIMGEYSHVDKEDFEPGQQISFAGFHLGENDAWIRQS